jgi:hypothetical protein
MGLPSWLATTNPERGVACFLAIHVTFTVDTSKRQWAV